MWRVSGVNTPSGVQNPVARRPGREEGRGAAVVDSVWNEEVRL